MMEQEMAEKVRQLAESLHFTMPDGSLPSDNLFVECVSTAASRHLWHELLKRIHPKQKVQHRENNTLKEQMANFLEEENINNMFFGKRHNGAKLEEEIRCLKKKREELELQYRQFTSNFLQQMERLKKLESYKKELEEKYLVLSRIRHENRKLKLKLNDFKTRITSEEFSNTPEKFFYLKEIIARGETIAKSLDSTRQMIKNSMNFAVKEIKEREKLGSTPLNHFLVDLESQKVLKMMTDYTIWVNKPPKLVGSAASNLKTIYPVKDVPITPDRFIFELTKPKKFGDLEMLREKAEYVERQKEDLQICLKNVIESRRFKVSGYLKRESDLRSAWLQLSTTQKQKFADWFAKGQLVPEMVVRWLTKPRDQEYWQNVESAKEESSTEQPTTDNKIIFFEEIPPSSPDNTTWHLDAKKILEDCESKREHILQKEQNLKKILHLWVNHPFGKWIPESQVHNGLTFDQISLQTLLNKK